MKRYLLAITTVLLLSVSGRAQISLSMDSVALLGPVQPDTVIVNQSYAGLLYYSNNGQTTVQDTVLFMMSLTDSLGNPTGNAFPIGAKLYSQNNPLPPAFGDTVGFSFSVDAAYSLGGNTTVIWPLVGIDPVGDTIMNDLYVLINSTTGQSGKLSTQSDDILLYPNPTQNTISIKQKFESDKIEQVRIIGTDGRVVFDGPYQGPINVASLPAGYYLVEAHTQAGEIHFKGFIRD